MDTWVDYTDPDTIEAITGDPLVTDGVYEAIAAASEALTVLTGYRGHPSGTATQEYVASRWIIRLTPAYRPVTVLLSVMSVSDDCATVNDVTNQFCIFAGDVRKRTENRWRTPYGSDVAVMLCNFCHHAHERLVLTYDFGSTIGAAGRRAAINLARQLWLSTHPEAGECILPERVTSMSREGLSYSFIDPMNFLDQGRTGIPSVDTYLMMVNPSKARAPAAVYIPEAPPGVVR